MHHLCELSIKAGQESCLPYLVLLMRILALSSRFQEPSSIRRLCEVRQGELRPSSEICKVSTQYIIVMELLVDPSSLGGSAARGAIWCILPPLLIHESLIFEFQIHSASPQAKKGNGRARDCLIFPDSSDGNTRSVSSPLRANSAGLWISPPIRRLRPYFLKITYCKQHKNQPIKRELMTIKRIFNGRTRSWGRRSRASSLPAPPTSPRVNELATLAPWLSII